MESKILFVTEEDRTAFYDELDAQGIWKSLQWEEQGWTEEGPHYYLKFTGMERLSPGNRGIVFTAIRHSHATQVY